MTLSIWIKGSSRGILAQQRARISNKVIVTQLSSTKLQILQGEGATYYIPTAIEAGFYSSCCQRITRRNRPTYGLKDLHANFCHIVDQTLVSKYVREPRLKEVRFKVLFIISCDRYQTWNEKKISTTL